MRYPQAGITSGLWSEARACLAAGQQAAAAPMPDLQLAHTIVRT
jgi:hypothetical protein